MVVNGSVVVMTSNDSPGLPNFFYLIVTKGCVQVTSADSCRTRKIEGVGTVELVCVGGLLRMSSESLLLVWKSVGGGFTGKGELDVWVVWGVTLRLENLYGIGAEWAGKGSTLPREYLSIKRIVNNKTQK